MNLLQAAMKYINAGLAVIPVWPDQRKNPHLNSISPYFHRLPNGSEWTRWARAWPSANIGLITGYWLNFIALDFDSFEAYDFWANDAGFGLRGLTWTVRTARGCHIWFKTVEDPGASRNYICGDFEVLVRARGGYCIVPPSIHHTGVRYRTVHKAPVFQIQKIEDVLTGWQEKQQKQPKSLTAVTKNFAGAGKIEDLIKPIGKPNNRGAFKAYCPFHDDNSPSAWVNPDQQRFGCNACWPGLWWDTANVLAMLNGISNGEALSLVGQQIPLWDNQINEANGSRFLPQKALPMSLDTDPKISVAGQQNLSQRGEL